MQLDDYLGGRGSVSVDMVEKCNDESCQAIYRTGRKTKRRLEGEATYMKVNFKISSTKKAKAGMTVNTLQDHLMNKQSALYQQVSVFATAEVSTMTVENCKGSTDVASKFDKDIMSKLVDEESSAAA